MYKFIKLLLSIIFINFAETYYFDVLLLIGLNINDYSLLLKEILIIVLYLIILFCVYYFYKDNITRDFRRFKRKLLPNLLMVIVFFIVVTLSVKVSEYLSLLIADYFKVTYLPVTFINVFNEPLNINSIIYIIKNILIIPFTSSIIYVLGINDLIKNKNKGIIYSGLIAAFFIGLGLKGSFLTILFSVIPYFVLYILLAWIYRKNNNNIWFASITLILYALLASVLIEKIL